MRVPGNGNPLGPQACQRTAPIFDGRMRYNLQFAYKRMEQVKAEKGYEGPAVVCAVYFVPIAGYIPTAPRSSIWQSQRDMEVWLAPVAGTRRAGAVPRLDPDADRDRRDAGDAVRLGARRRAPPRPAPRRSDTRLRGGASAPSYPQTIHRTRGVAGIDSAAEACERALTIAGLGRTDDGSCRLPDVVARGAARPRCRGERSPTAPESAIRARFVPDSFACVKASR